MFQKTDRDYPKRHQVSMEGTDSAQESLLQPDAKVLMSGQDASCDAQRWRLIALAQLVFNVFLLVITVLLFGNMWKVEGNVEDKSKGELSLYSPANEAIEYVYRRFNRSRGDDKTAFQGWPSDERDALWASQYMNYLLVATDAQTAERLPDRTARLAWPGREHEYVMTLDMFHQLHCLDIVRMALYNDRYDKHFYEADGSVNHCKWLHVDHCLDQVRQALVCQADVSVIYYEWSDIVQGLRPRVDNAHMCRNHEKIMDWTRQREVPKEQWRPSHRVVQNADGGLKIEVGRNHALNQEGECNAI